jgi:hypothetical protein
MTTQELKQYIDRVLGNNIRCLLPSYWWKNLFHSVADRIDEVEQKVDGIEIPDGVPIVNSESELDKLKLPNGSVASVVTDGYGFSQCYIPTYEETQGDFDVLFSKLTKVSRLGLTSYTLQEGEEVDVKLIGADYPLNRTFVQLVGFYENGAFVAVFTATINGVLVQNFITTDAGLNAINKILAENDLRLLKVGDFDGSDVDVENELALLDKVFTINGTSDVYNKNGKWEKLAKTSEIISEDEVVFTVGFDENWNILLTDEEKEANKKAYSKCSNSDVKCKLRWYLTSDADNIDKVYYSSPQPESVNIEKLLAGKIWISQNIVFRGVDLGEYPAEFNSSIFGKYDISFNSNGEAGIIPNLSTGRVNFIYMSGDSVPEHFMKFNKTIYETWNSTYGRPIPIMVWNADGDLKLLPASIGKNQSNQFIVTVWDNLRTKQYELKSDGSMELLSTQLMFESEMIDNSAYGVQNGVVKKYVDDKVAAIDFTVDAELSQTSTNAVQNKAVYSEMSAVIRMVIGTMENLAEVKADINETDKVTAAALNDLNKRLQDITTRLDNAGL